MHLEFSLPRDPVTAFPPPVWSIDLQIATRIPHSMNGEFDALEAVGINVEGKLGDRLIWPQSWQATYNYLTRGGETILIARLPMNREILAEIESRRTGALQFSLNVLVRIRPLLKQGEGYAAPVTPARSDVMNSTTLQFVIERDPWLRILRTLGYSETEVFEIQTGQRWEDPQLASALKELQAAVGVFRQRIDPHMVLVNCYKAIESSAKYKGAGKKVEGFELMLEEAFPGEPDKREYVDHIIKNINEFAHLGRHGQYPERRITWEEARFILTSTLGLFDLLTNNRRLKLPTE